MNTICCQLSFEWKETTSHLKENLKRRRDREANTPSQIGRQSPLRKCEMIETEESFVDECDLEIMSILSGSPFDSDDQMIFEENDDFEHQRSYCPSLEFQN